MEDDDYLNTPSTHVDFSTFKSGIPKSVTCLTIEGSVVNKGETTEPDSCTIEPIEREDEDDCWEHPDETEEFFSSNDTEDAENMSQASWEEISEVSSVHSFHSKTGMTFLEVARLAELEKKAVNENDMDNWIAVAKGRKHEDPTPEEELASADPESMGELFDDQFMIDGAKGMRGGKERYMYNRQPKKKYRQWRSKNQLDTMVSCGRVPAANNTILDRQGHRIMVKA